jgi:hypothetical protein
MLTSHSSLEAFKSDDENAAENMANMLGPSHVDQIIRQAISICWMALSKDRKTPEVLEQEIRRLFERALKDFREDSASFAKSK